MRVLGIIPARAGSKRVPKKNFREFVGTTLTDLAICQGLESKLIDRLVVNSDADEIEMIASKYQDEGVTFLRRPAELAADESPAIDYMNQTLNHFDAIDEKYDLIVIIQPSSPLRTGLDIDSTIQLLLDNQESDSAVSVVQLAHMVHPHKIKQMEGVTLVPWMFDEGEKTAAHEIPDLYVRNCAVYVFKESVIKQGATFGKKSIGYLMPSETSVDINDPLDFEFAEFLYKKSVD